MASALVDLQALESVDLEARVMIAQKVGRLLSKGDSKDHAVALELARLLVEDVSVSVRSALAKELQQCAFLPKRIVETIANDIQDISLPFLVASKAIDDVLLEDIVRCGAEGQQKAVASRAGLSEVVSYAICDESLESAVDILMGNSDAALSEKAYKRVVERFPTHTSLLEKMVRRADMPFSIVEQVIFKITESYGQYLCDRFELSSDYSTYILSLTRRQVFNQTLEVSPLFELQNYLSRLKARDGLTSDVLLAYLQHRHVRTFIAALSVLTDLPFEAMQEKIGTHNRAVLARILDSIGMSTSVIGVLLIAYDRLFRG